MQIRLTYRGKFGQRSGMSERKFYCDPEQYFATLMDDSLEIQQIRIMSEKAVMVRYKQKDDYVESQGNTNVVVACFVTSYARLRLLKFMQQIDRQLLYTDTDR